MDSIKISFVLDLDKDFEFFKQCLLDFFTSIMSNQDQTSYLSTLEHRIKNVENNGRINVPASTFTAFFPEHTNLSRDIDIHFFMSTETKVSEEEEGQEPTITTVRHLCDIVLCANPTGSLDLAEMYPILTLTSMALDDEVEIEEGVIGYRWPQGIILIPQENIKTPSIRFGIEEIKNESQDQIPEGFPGIFIGQTSS